MSASVEDEVLQQVKDNLDLKIAQLTQQIALTQSRIQSRVPVFTEINIRLDDLNRENRQDIRDVERDTNRLEKTQNLRDRLERGEVDIKIVKR